MNADFYSQFVSSGDLVFDIGANIGLNTEIFLGMGCRVVAVEPHPECNRVLHHNCPQATILPDAVSRTFGQRVRLHTGLDTRLSTLSLDWITAVKQSGRFGQYDWWDSLTVNTVTLDWMVTKYGVPQFIKIDAEGMDHEIIAGLSQRVPALCFEFVPEFLGSAETSIRYLNALGLQKYQYLPGGSTDLSEQMRSDELLQALNTLPKESSTYCDIYARI